MTEKLLDNLKELYPLTELDVGEFANIKAGGMKFSVKAYCAEGLGHISLMRATGFFGLMKMDTLMIIPKKKDLPLYSYDRIYAMGNDTLIVELYDTLTSKYDVPELAEVKAKFAHLPERDAGEHWYDDIKLSESISKKGKRECECELDALAAEHFSAYLKSGAADVTDETKKAELTRRYVCGLLSEGGPSTDVFKKKLGVEFTEKLFKKVLFGIDNM